MSATGTFLRFAMCLLAAGAWLSAQAAGQSVWLTGQVSPVTLSTSASPPALVFDIQDRPQIVCETGAATGTLQHASGDAAGVIPNWSPWANTTVASSQGPGQIYLARAATRLYLGFRPLTVPSYIIRAGLFDGTAWQAYTAPSANTSAHFLSGLVVDSTPQPQWLVLCQDASPLTSSSYNLLTQTAPNPPTIVPVASNAGGVATIGVPADKILYQGGDALLDRFGTFHTIQYSTMGGGTLLYAKGPLAGPFQVTDNLDAGWAVKLGRPGLTLDAGGMAHVVYTQQWPGYGLKHLTQTATGWTSEWVEQGGNAAGYLGTFPRILVDRIGVLHVIYVDGLHGQVKHASKVQGVWQIETIDQVGMRVNTQQAGMLAAAIDSQGGIGVVYYDATNAAYKYAYRLPLDQEYVPLNSQPAEKGINQ